MAKSIKGSQTRSEKVRERSSSRSKIALQDEYDKEAMPMPNDSQVQREARKDSKKRQESTKKTTQKAMGPNTRQSPGTLFKPSVGKATNIKGVSN